MLLANRNGIRIGCLCIDFVLEMLYMHANGRMHLDRVGLVAVLEKLLCLRQAGGSDDGEHSDVASDDRTALPTDSDVHSRIT